MNDPDKCNHVNFDEYFKRCEDCGLDLENMPEEIQEEYNKQIEE